MKYMSVIEKLCSIDTSTGTPSAKEVARVCREQIVSPFSFEITPSASSGAAGDIIFRRQGTGKCKVLLLGHYDTVPPKDLNQNYRGDLFFAAGSYDMKGGIALALELFDYLQESYFSEITLYLAGDEEWRSSPLEVSGRWDAVLAFEGGEKDGLVASRFGAGVLEVSVVGKALRATYPPLGTSSIQSLAQLLLEIEKKNTDLAHFTASQIFTSSAVNVIPHQSSVAGVLRYKSLALQKEFLERIPSDINGLPVRYQLQELIPPLQATSDTKDVLELLGTEAITRVGASDISWLSGQSPIMLDGLGPLGGGEHSEDEYISISSLEQQLSLAKRVVDYVLRKN